MDRLIVYPGAIPLDTDILSVERNIMTAFGWLAQAALGTATGVAGLACTPTNPASMTVNIGPGAIWAQEVIDQNNFGSLPADAAPLMKMGILPQAAGTNFTLTAPLVSGQSINYLIEAAFEEMDTDPVVLPYVNPSNPSQPYSGPANSGTPQNTVRAQIVDLQLKAGVAANTGTQLTPPVDAGYVGLYVITVNYGQTTIAAPNITVYPGAPFAGNITEAWLAQNFAALNGNATEVFNVATATQATHALSLGQAENEFAALAGNAAQAFAVAPATATTQAPQLQQVETLIASATANLGTMSEQNASDVTITGGSAALSSVTLAQPASAATQAPQLQQVETLIASATANLGTMSEQNASDVTITGGSAALSSVTLAQPASTATQAPQLQQVQALIETAIGASSGGVKVFKQNDTYTVPEGVTSVEVIVIGGGGGGMAPRIYIGGFYADMNLQYTTGDTLYYNNWLGTLVTNPQGNLGTYTGTLLFNFPWSAGNLETNTNQGGIFGDITYGYGTLGVNTPSINYAPSDNIAYTFTGEIASLAYWNMTSIAAYPGGGGAGGGFAYVPSISVTPGQQISITVGAGGTGEQPWILSNPTTVAPYYNTRITGYAAPPTAGGTSSFGTIVTATGGTPSSYDNFNSMNIWSYAVDRVYSKSGLSGTRVTFPGLPTLDGQEGSGGYISPATVYATFPDLSTGGTATGPSNGTYLSGGAGAVGNLWNIPYYISTSIPVSPVQSGDSTSVNYGFSGNTPVSPGGGGGGAGNGGSFGQSNYGGINNNMSSQPAKPGSLPSQPFPAYVISGGSGGNGGFTSNGTNGQFPGGGGGGGSVVVGSPGFPNPIPAANCFAAISDSGVQNNVNPPVFYGGAVTGGGNGAPGVVIVIEHSGS